MGCVGDAGAGVPGDQVDFGGQIGAADEADDFVGVLGLVGDAAEHDVLEGDLLAVRRGWCDGVEDAAMFHLRLMGMMASRTSSLGALRLMASLGRTFSWAKRRMPGTMPEVETVMRGAAMPTSSVSRRTAAMKLS
jgi:hypothetical protein